MTAQGGNPLDRTRLTGQLHTFSGRLVTPLSGRLSTTADSLFFLDFTFNIQDISVFINDILDPLAVRLKSPI